MVLTQTRDWRPKAVPAFSLLVLNFSLVLFFLISRTAHGQSYPITDRSLAYATPASMSKGHTMLEYGYFDVNTLGGINGLSLGGISILTRFGIFEDLEFRVASGWTRLNQQGSANAQIISGLSALKTGLKTTLIPEGSKMPVVSLLAELEWSKIGNPAFRPQRVSNHIRIIIEKFLNERFIIGTNLGLLWRDALVALPTYAISLRTALGPKWSLYSEFYGQNAPNSASDNYVDAAVEHWILPHAVVDLAFGIGVSDGASDYFISLGGAFRFGAGPK